MRFLLFISTLLFGSVAFATLSDTDRQEFLANNLVRNGGFESGVGADGQKWTASSPATLTFATSGSNLLDGKTSAVLDTTAAAQTLSYSAIAVPNGLKGMAGTAICKIMVPSGTATHLLEVTDGTTALNSVTVTSSTTPTYTFVPFTFPSSGNVVLRLKSVAVNEPAIAVDSCWLGETEKIPQKAQVRSFTTNTTFTVPLTVSELEVLGCGGGGAGGGGAGGTAVGGSGGGGGGAGGKGAQPKLATTRVTPGTVLTITLGAGGTPAGAAAYTGSGGTGGTGSSTTVAGTGVSLTFDGAAGGGGGSNAILAGAGGTGGTAGSDVVTSKVIQVAGGAGGNGGKVSGSPTNGAAGSAGPSNMYVSAGGAGGAAGTSGGGGSGGGGAPGVAIGGAGSVGSAQLAGPSGANNGIAAGANSCAGGGGGGGTGFGVVAGGATGGAGGSGYVTIKWVGPAL